MEREDVVAIVFPLASTLVTRATIPIFELPIFEIVKVCPETVTVQLLNSIGTVNWPNTTPPPCPPVTVQEANEEPATSRKSGLATDTDVDWPVVKSASFPVNIALNLLKVIEAEITSPALNVRIGCVGEAVMLPKLAAETYIGVELP